MNCRYPCLISAASFILAGTAPADVVWSGEQNLAGEFQHIDFNSDSLVDVLITYDIYGNNSITPSTYNGYLNAKVDGVGVDGSNRILIDSSRVSEAAVPFGTLISDTLNASHEWKSGMFASGLVSYWSTQSAEPDTEWNGLLGENGNTYIGIEFEVEGLAHYGWVNIALGPEEGSHGFANPITTSWAYESTPNTAIVAGAIPEPSTGILTVGGSLALLFLARSRRRFRRRRG